MGDRRGAFLDDRGADMLASMYLARVYVTLKPTVNDPPGLTIRGGLHALGFASVASVRSGKYMEIRIDAPSADDAAAQVEEMCRKLLANPVIEDYRFEISEVA
jgi:phosphoribosylformylglycinamidine synthase